MDLDCEYRAYQLFRERVQAEAMKPPPDADGGMADAWLDAVGRGEVDGSDAALAQFKAQWEATHPGPVQDATDWIPVEREGKTFG